MKKLLLAAILTVLCASASAKPEAGKDYTYYTVKGSSYIKRMPDEVLIPRDQANEDFIEYENWLDDGNKAKQWVEPIHIVPVKPEIQPITKPVNPTNQ